jgi:trk system potassium uptake protein TrkH
MILLVLMFFGGCAGSTGGGLKQLRIMVVAKYFYRELMKLLRPNLVNRIRIGEVTLEERTCANILGLVLLWLSVFVAATVAVLVILAFQAREDGQLVTSLSAVAATLNNIGPGLGDVGSAANYGWMPAPAKVILLLCMLMGRLEVYSVLIVLLPVTWRK